MSTQHPDTGSSMTILCRICGTTATDSTHKGKQVKKCPDCETIKFRQLEVDET